MKNSELLESKVPNALLSNTEQQKRFVLTCDVQKHPCPNCATLQNLFEASGVSIDDWDFNHPGERVYHCIKCKRELKQLVPIIMQDKGGWHWGLVPIKVE